MPSSPPSTISSPGCIEFSDAEIASKVTFEIPYPFEQIQPTRYKFFSLGKNKIEKIVERIKTIKDLSSTRAQNSIILAS